MKFPNFLKFFCCSKAKRNKEFSDVEIESSIEKRTLAFNLEVKENLLGTNLLLQHIYQVQDTLIVIINLVEETHEAHKVVLLPFYKELEVNKNLKEKYYVLNNTNLNSITANLQTPNTKDITIIKHLSEIQEDLKNQGKLIFDETTPSQTYDSRSALII